MMSKSNQSVSSFDIPFTSQTQLCSDLILQDAQGTTRILSSSQRNCLPGQPSTSLQDAEVLAYVEKELTTPTLNQLSPHLWLVATPSSSHISPLHDQIVRGRNIVISENPELHLVWIDSRIFVKPLPDYLLSRPFWDHYFRAADPDVLSNALRARLAQAALGYLRTYFYLIRHQSDYRIGIANNLIPANVSYSDFMAFITGFGSVQDDQVSPRYRFGELRMSRLNFWTRIFLRKPYFHKVAWQYADYFARYYGPILFLFGAFSVVLSAMQVGVGARAEWHTFQGVSAWFAVVTLLFICLIAVILGLDFVLMAGREIVYAVRHRFVERTGHPT